MGNRLSKIYTRTGDDGSTGLGDGSRVAKDSARVEAYGTVDEANSAIGIVLAVAAVPEDVRRCLVEVQHDMFELGGELASRDTAQSRLTSLNAWKTISTILTKTCLH
jgi:cob(I)alamin adenosyltransferase